MGNILLHKKASAGSDNEGEIFVGCAGGTEFLQSMSITPTEVSKQHMKVH